ncbi:MAG: sugar ABC transporter permease [Oscillospiraceae bacterium]|nr:sugar ABC transporter permease [Oscillospiraceae bacterium]
MSDNNAVQTKKPKTRGEMTNFQWTLREMRVNKVAYFLLAPFFILFFIFTVLPVILSLFFSFTIFNMLEPPKFVFMDNYIRLLLDDDIFLLSVKNTFFFAAITGPLSYFLSLMFAWFINELTPRIRSIVTLIFYAPSISGNVYLIFTILFTTDQHGLVNGTLMKYGVITKPIAFFADPKWIIPLVIVVALWISLGTSFLAFIAGFQIVDRSLYEAAAVDGVKNRWQELWFVTLPYMRPQMMFGAILAITGSFSFGGIITGLCGFPSPDYCAHTMMHHLEDYGNLRFEMGYASAIAVLLFILMIGSNAVVRKLLSKVGT